MSFILFGLDNFSDQNVDAFDNNYYYGGINFVAPLRSIPNRISR